MVREHLFTRSAVFAGTAVMLAAAASLSADDTMTLRVDDTRARPGELAEVVIRTYEPQSVGQGQICLQAGTAAGGNSLGVALEARASAVLSAKERASAKQVAPPGPLLDLEGFAVFSEAGDAVSEVVFDGLSQTAVLAFEAPSGTINQSDGPLAVLYFRIAPTAVPGDVFELVLDTAASSLIDPEGETLGLELRPGELKIVELGDSVKLEVAGDRIPPGDIARLGIETKEDLQVASGQVVLRYDPEIGGGQPTVSISPYQGQASFVVDGSTPGWLLVSFASPDDSLSWPSGEMVAIDLPTSGQVPGGYESPIRLDPEMTFLVDPEGVFLPVEIEDDGIGFDD